MIKTTVYFDESVALSLRQLARVQRRPQADIIRDAVAQYIAQSSRPQSTAIGAYHSGRSDVAERAEELAGALVRKRR